MAVAPGLYGLTLEKVFINASAIDLESESNQKVALCTDTYAPNFDTHDFYADLTNEIGSGGGYTTGGNVLTGTEVTIASGSLKYDATDTPWPTSTITNAMGAFGYCDSPTDEALFLSDFVTAVSTTGGTLTVVWHSNGIFTVDYVP